MRLETGGALICSFVALAAGGAPLQNDTFSGNGAVNGSADFAFLDGASVILSAADAGGPLTVLGIDVLAVPVNGGGLTANLVVDVWSDHYPDAGANPWPPKTEYGDILDSSLSVQSVTPSTTQLNRISFTPPIVMNGGSIFVRILNPNDPSFMGPNEVTLAADLGPLVPGVNFFNHSYPNYLPLPYDGGTFFIGGNWIIRGALPTSSQQDGGPGGGDGGVGPGPDGGGGPGPDGGGGPGPDGGGGPGGDGGSTTGLALTSINPNIGYSGSDTTVILLGHGFQAGVAAIVGTTPLTNLTMTSSAVINATVPKGINAGVYDVLVVNPDGSQATLSKAFTIQSGSRVGTGCGCQSEGAMMTALWAAVVLLVVARRPRRQPVCWQPRARK